MVVNRWTVILLLALLAPVGAAAQEGREGEGGSTPAAAARAATGALRLEVSVSERSLRVLQGDSVLGSYPVAVGKPQYPTPRGSFSIRRVVWNPRWVPPAAKWARNKRPRGPGDPQNPMGRAKLFFKEPDYYIHGTNNEESLGEAASHGCVRMANDDVVELARLVMEHGGEAREPAWFQRILNRVRSTQEVRLSEPVRVVIVE